MSLPHPDPDDIIDGCAGLLFAVPHAMDTFTTEMFAFFLDVVPERGDALLGRFRAFAGDREKVYFNDFIRHMIKEYSFKLLYPRGCLLDKSTQRANVAILLPLITKRGIRSNAALLRFYFSDHESEPFKEIIRQDICRGCVSKACPHYVAPPKKRITISSKRKCTEKHSPPPKP